MCGDEEGTEVLAKLGSAHTYCVIEEGCLFGALLCSLGGAPLCLPYSMPQSGSEWLDVKQFIGEIYLFIMVVKVTRGHKVNHANMSRLLADSYNLQTLQTDASSQTLWA